MDLFTLLDTNYGPWGDLRLKRLLAGGASVNARRGTIQETPLHVAARRCRLSAIRILVKAGAEVDACTAGGKTACIHAARRGFNEVAIFLEKQGAKLEFTPADRLAVALSNKDEKEAKQILSHHPEAARTGNPEEDRLLADMSGRNEAWPVSLLIAAGASLMARGLDGGTPLHQAAWFGKVQNTHLLLNAKAPLEVFDDDHRSSPLGWAVHGSRESGGAAQRQAAYMAIVESLLKSGAKLYYPNDASDAFYRRLLKQASRPVQAQLRAARITELTSK